MRFGLIASILFTDITTSFTTGSVNNMHDSLTPIAGMMPLLEYDAELYIWRKRCWIHEYHHVYDVWSFLMRTYGWKNS